MRERIRRLGRAIRASLKGERKRRVEAAGTDVEALLGGGPAKLKGDVAKDFDQHLPPALYVAGVVPCRGAA